MALPLIAIPIIAGLAKIGSTIISNEMTKSSNEKARKESRMLAEITRRDTLKQQKTQNIFNTKRSDLTDEKLGFSRYMAEKTSAMRDEDILSQKRRSDRNVVESGVSGIGMQDEDWLYKNKILSRF